MVIVTYGFDENAMTYNQYMSVISSRLTREHYPFNYGFDPLSFYQTSEGVFSRVKVYATPFSIN